MRPNTSTETLRFTRRDTDFQVEVEFTVFGEYRRATWEDPEEFPEVEIVEVRPINAETGEVRAKPLKLTSDEFRKLDRALWEQIGPEMCRPRSRRYRDYED